MKQIIFDRIIEEILEPYSSKIINSVKQFKDATYSHKTYLNDNKIFILTMDQISVRNYEGCTNEHYKSEYISEKQKMLKDFISTLRPNESQFPEFCLKFPPKP
ncbi:MAG: hypothetical protein LEGION0403_FIIPPAGN_01804 [Legionella sp.]|uniref:hypothetical protein n=1 Tax=Legionella sp. TaxID=459 RepID=UPI003D141E50